jgi:putative DNA primase/helicase
MTARELTDLGNAEAFATENAPRLRYLATWGKWMAHDGARWRVDALGMAQHLAGEFVRSRFVAAGADVKAAADALARATEVGDSDLASLQRDRMKEPQQRLRWFLRCHDRSRIDGCVALARSSPALAVAHDALDADAWLFNVANGTIDLRSGALRPHDPGDLITKLAPIAFDGAATCPTWTTFLEQALGGDREMVDFVWRAIGYSLTGSTRDHALLFLFGPGGTGKSTTFRIWHELLGDYAVRAARSLLFVSHGERHPTELASLHGARLVTCNEVDEGATFDEALVKDLTGGEAITARRMREDFWSFAPTHKIAVGGNHKPRVKNFDDAMRRRLRLVPFTVKPETVDPELFGKLVAELPGILAWAVRGCLAWQRDGLGEPAAVREQTDAYQAESDPLREFFQLRCVFEPAARIPRKQLRLAYEEYAKENGAEPLGAKRFSEGLKRRGVEGGNVRHNGRTHDGWRGVRLASDAEREGNDRWGRGDVVGSTFRLIADREFPRKELTGNTTPPDPHIPTDDGHAFSDLLGEAGE